MFLSFLLLFQSFLEVTVDLGHQGHQPAHLNKFLAWAKMSWQFICLTMCCFLRQKNGEGFLTWTKGGRRNKNDAKTRYVASPWHLPSAFAPLRFGVLFKRNWNQKNANKHDTMSKWSTLNLNQVSPNSQKRFLDCQSQRSQRNVKSSCSLPLLWSTPSTPLQHLQKHIIQINRLRRSRHDGFLRAAETHEKWHL